MNPKLMVVVPVYNCPLNIVTHTIKSVLSQAYPNLRIVIIDDYSKEPLYSELSKQFQGLPSVSLIRNNTNLGFANTLNKALALCTDEEYFFVLEHDCELVSQNYLLNSIKHFDNPKIAAVCGENLLPCSEDLSQMKRIFVNHLCEDIHDELVEEVGFSLLKADVFRIDVLKQVGGFQSAGHWKFASEEHIISYKIRSNGYTIIKDPKLRFRAYWGGQENLRQNLRKEALYGRGLGCAIATARSDLEIGKSHQLNSKKNSRILQMQYVFLTVVSLPLLLYSVWLGFALMCFTSLVYFVYLLKGALLLKSHADKLLFILTGYLRAWVYIPNFCIGLVYGVFARLRKDSGSEQVLKGNAI